MLPTGAEADQLADEEQTSVPEAASAAMPDGEDGSGPILSRVHSAPLTRSPSEDDAWKHRVRTSGDVYLRHCHLTVDVPGGDAPPHHIDPLPSLDSSWSGSSSQLRQHSSFPRAPPMTPATQE